jgi:nitrate reductase gamma subunit
MNETLFGVYPYIAITVFLLGSLVRFEYGQYTWRSGSSQLLRGRMLVIGSNCFHIGILAILAGHFVGLLTPHAVYTGIGITVREKQLAAMGFGGAAGVLCFFGLSLLIYRRLSDPRIRATSSVMDIAILLMLWVQLSMGLGSILVSAQHLDGSEMLVLADWAQRIVTFRPGAAAAMAHASLIYKLHILLGLTILLVFPFSRLVHIWSAPVTYVGRRYQIVRRRGGAAGERP